MINPIPGQEEENAEFLEKNNLAIWIKSDDNIEEKLKEIIANDDKLKEIKDNIKKKANKNTAKEICDILLKDNI